MNRVYIVMAGGCVQYVAATDTNQTVMLLDMDDRAEMCPVDADSFDADLEQAEKLVRVW